MNSVNRNHDLALMYHKCLSGYHQRMAWPKCDWPARGVHDMLALASTVERWHDFAVHAYAIILQANAWW